MSKIYTPFTWTCESEVNQGSTQVNAFTWYYRSGVNPGYRNGLTLLSSRVSPGVTEV